MSTQAQILAYQSARGMPIRPTNGQSRRVSGEVR